MIVDANVLLYAVDEGSPLHAPAREWLDGAMNGVERVGLPWVSLLAFQRIITHPRVTTAPLGAADAWGYITDWLDAPLTWIPAAGSQHRDILGTFLVAGDTRGNLVPDAHLAALAIEHGTSICSFDSDFARFTEVSWIHPARP